MLSTVNDRALSTISYYTGVVLRLSVSLPLCCWATISDSNGTATGSRERGSAFSRSQHGRPQGIGAEQIEQIPPAADRRHIVALWL